MSRGNNRMLSTGLSYTGTMKMHKRHQQNNARIPSQAKCVKKVYAKNVDCSSLSLLLNSRINSGELEMTK